MNIHEIWKPIAGYEGLYEVSNMGRVKSLPRRGTKGKILIPQKSGSGYLQVNLSKAGICKSYFVHCLVWKAFNGEVPAGLEVNHISKNKFDNRLENFELMTHKENTEYSLAKAVLAYDKSGNYVQEFKSLREASEWLGKPEAHKNICGNLKGRYRSAYGYIWKYKD